ncbi:MAG TPA: serine hydrolase domain-containing protein [Ktedonobacteraceae bacterium]|nr:serine hydrolase domain-containing protein [Ktedonobacteraceae bacterium]
MSESITPTNQLGQEKKERIETAVMVTRNGRPRSLHERMTDYTIPGVSLAMINNYHLEWACGYGVRKMGEPERIDSETLFQACSISKVVTASAVLRLVEAGRLDLDADVNLFLKSWKVPAHQAQQSEVTIRRLLSHTAGISVPWFAGYHREQDIPTLHEILNGEQPSNTPEICVVAPPGEQFQYAGGGYCILQQLLIDVMQQPFPTLMQELVLEPLDMTHSTYEQPLPAPQAKMAASGHRKSGKPVAGNWYVYPEMAAAGLWTTPTDLAQFALELQCARAEKPHRLLSTQMVKELLTPQSHGDARGDMGLGVFVQGAGPGARFGHPGDNAGFTSCWVSLQQGGQGCVLMTNSDNGGSLQQELLHTITQVYAWPEIAPEKNHEGQNGQ